MDKRALLEIALAGNTAAQSGNLLEAVANYSQVISAWPTEYSFLLNRAICHLKMDYLFLALFDINQALSLAAEERVQAKCLFIRSRILQKLGQHEHSSSDLFAASTIDPYNEEIAEELLLLQQASAAEGGGVGSSNQEKELFKEKLRGYDLTAKCYYKIKVNFHLVQAANLPTNLWNYEGVRVEGIRPSAGAEVIRSHFSLFGDVHQVRRLSSRAVKGSQVFVHFDNPVSPIFTIAYFQQRIDEELSAKERGLLQPLKLTFAPTDTQTDLKFARPKYPGQNRGQECYYWRTTLCNMGTRCAKLHLPASKGIDRQIWMKHKE